MALICYSIALFFGFYGALIESVHNLRRFIALSFITDILFGILAILLWNNESNVSDIGFGKQFFYGKLKKSSIVCSKSGNATIINDSLNELQTHYKCCGWKGSQDYYNLIIEEKKTNKECDSITTILVPDSCCLHKSPCILSPNGLNMDSCKTALNKWRNLFDYTLIVMFCSLIALLILNLFAIYLRKEIIKKKKLM
jgi:hypothetical protein